jgi:hypothetical protein
MAPIPDHDPFPRIIGAAEVVPMDYVEPVLKVREKLSLAFTAVSATHVGSASAARFSD